MNPHFFTAPFFFAFICFHLVQGSGFRVHGSWFKVQGSKGSKGPKGVVWRISSS